MIEPDRLDPRQQAGASAADPWRPLFPDHSTPPAHRATQLRLRWSLLFLCCCAVCGIAHGDESAASSDDQPVDYAIIVTGNELLTGVYADGHTYFLTRSLRPLGLHCVGSQSVDDRADDVQQALTFALRRCRLVIVTGGLGPTETDITREALSQFTGIGLHEQPDVLHEMTRRFGIPPEQLRANLRRQTQVPDQGTYLPNESGTAIGLVFEQPDQVIVALPGPPRELQPMVQKYLVPYLARRFGVHTIGCSLTVRFVGIGQSQIDQTMQDHIPLPADLMQTSQFESGRVDFTFALPHDAPHDQERLRQLRDELYNCLGEFIYADDAQMSLEDATLAPIASRKESIALAEIGSGGILAVALSQSALGRQSVIGDFVAPTEKRLLEMLQLSSTSQVGDDSDVALEEIAKIVAQRTHSDWAIVVGEPATDGGTSQKVELLIRRPDAAITRSQIAWADLSPTNRDRLTTQLLDSVRRALAPPQTAR